MEFDHDEEILGDKDRIEIITSMNKDCVFLLAFYGETKEPDRSLINSIRMFGERLGIVAPSMKTRKTREYQHDVERRDQIWSISITSSSEDPQLSEFIEFRIGVDVRVMYLRWDDALILEDWKMGGENIYAPEMFDPDEYYGGELTYDNPRRASLEELVEFRDILNLVMGEIGLNSHMNRIE